MITAFRLALCGVALLVAQAQAAQTGDSLKINFTGRLLTRTACSVNQDQQITVAFGNVAIDKVDSGQFIQAVPYTLDCGSAGTGNTVQMTLKATPVSGDAAAMASNAQGLWLKFLNEGQEQPLNTAFTVADWHNPPKLEIQLEKDPAVALQESAFTGTATLMAEYF